MIYLIENFYTSDLNFAGIKFNILSSEVKYPFLNRFNF
jgi:hypothetical protein